MRRLISLLSLFFVLAIVGGALADDGILLEVSNAASPQFFWAAAGSDSNNCATPVTACQTITHFNAFSFPTNAVVHFNGGDTFTGGLVITTTGLAVTSYGTGQPKISSGNSTACATITNIAGVTINNLNCVGGGVTTNTTNGIYFLSSNSNATVQGATIINNTVSGYGQQGIFVLGNNGTSGFNNVVINNNTVHDNTGNDTTYFTSCIFVSGTTNAFGAVNRTNNTNVTVNNNIVYNCPGTNGNTHGSGSGITITSTTTGTVSNNLVHDAGSSNSNCGGPVGIILEGDDTVTVQFNEVFNISNGTGCDGEGLDIDNETINSVMQYNYVHDISTGSTADVLICGCAPISQGLVWNNNTLRFNVVVNILGAHQSINVSAGNTGSNQPVTNSFIYNNTVYNINNGVVNAPFVANSGATGANWTGNVANNIFYSGAGATIDVAGAPNVLFAGNDYFNTSTFSVDWNGTSYSSLASWQSATGQEKVSGSPVGTTSNPSLFNPGTHTFVGGYSSTRLAGYHPTAGSPVLPNAGLNLNTDFSINPGTQDYYGTAVTASTLPIGASAATFVFPGSGGTSSISLVQHLFNNNGGAGTSHATTLTGTTAGNFLIIGIVYCNNAGCNTTTFPTIISVTSSNVGETCIHAGGAAALGPGLASDIWYCPNIVGGSDTITVTASTSVFYLGPDVVEVHGVSATNPLDSTGTFPFASSIVSYSVSTGDVTSNASEFIYSMGVSDGSISGFTFGQTQLNSELDEYQISTTAGSFYSNTASWTGNAQWTLSIAAFK